MIPWYSEANGPNAAGLASYCMQDVVYRTIRRRNNLIIKEHMIVETYGATTIIWRREEHGVGETFCCHDEVHGEFFFRSTATVEVFNNCRDTLIKLAIGIADEPAPIS